VDESFIRIDRLSRHFGDTLAVSNVSVEIARGEFFSLLGPSGCGKTTLLRMIAGFEYPDEGEIFIDDIRITDLSPDKRPTNMVFQSYAIFPHLNVQDNIAYGLRKEGLSRTELSTRVRDALAMMKLDGFAERKPDQLSGGQRQRVALARALVRRPKVLLLDEPLGALDRRLREAMQFELRQLQRNLGITFIFVTHDQEEALAMSDRVAVMSGGKILQVASPRVLYETPNCREVADFIGEMNFFAGKIVHIESDALMIEAENLAVVRVPRANAGTDRTVGENVLLALRPEKILLSRKPVTGQFVMATLGDAAFLGERTHFNALLEGREKPVSVSAQNRGPDLGLQNGDKVFLSWDPGAILLLAD
jgi:spermidine/putrescine transport system ATP-binding protein/putrescine transport system ATP-binding protein